MQAGFSFIGIGSTIATNLAAAAIGGVAVWSFTEWFIPMARGRMRRLPRLNGTKWRRRNSGSQRVQSTLSIRQSGTRITATIMRNDIKRQRTFRYRGQISGHQIVLQWEDADSPEQMIGAMVLHLNAHLTLLTGLTSYYKISSGQVVANRVVFDRLI